MDAEMIIEKLGGTSEASKFFEVTTGAVSQWRKAGMPRARLMYVRAMRPDIYAAAAGDSAPIAQDCQKEVA